MYWIIKDIVDNPFLVGKYLVSGTIGAGSNIFAYYIFLDKLGYWYIVSASLSFFFGYAIAFFLQKYWTFGDYNHEKFTKQAAAYFLISCLNLLFNLTILLLLVEFANMGHFYSQITAVCTVSVFSYFMNRHITFNHEVL